MSVMHRLTIICDSAFSSNSAGMHVRSLAEELLNHNIQVTILSFSVWRGAKKVILRKISHPLPTSCESYSKLKLARLLQEFHFSVISVIYTLIDGFTNRRSAYFIYSPSVFTSFIPFFTSLRQNQYSIFFLRDIIPESWNDVGILRPGISSNVIRKISNIGIKYSDEVWVQSLTDVEVLSRRSFKRIRGISVRSNWTDGVPQEKRLKPASKEPEQLRGIYAGSIGDFQGIGLLSEIIKEFSKYNICIDIYSADIERLQHHIRNKQMDYSRCRFLMEVTPDQLNERLPSYHFGLVILDADHTTGHIPGKVMSYIQFGLAIYGIVNRTNDLPEIVRRYRLGYLGRHPSNVEEFVRRALEDQLDASAERDFIGAHSEWFDMRPIVEYIKEITCKR